MTDLETQLRTTLHERAALAPPPEPLAHRLLSEVPARASVRHQRRGWRTWSLPLLAAGAVAAITVTVVGLGAIRHNATPPPPPALSEFASPVSSPVVQSAPPSSAAASASAPVRTVVTGFRALDLTFVSADRGWALGSADCLRGSGRCTALFHTTDGRSWTAVPGAAFNVPGVQNCAAPCVEHIRFANDDVGYAFSPDALFMTVDGGAQWTRQSGRGAEALETLNGNVIRVVSDHSGCPGPCDVRVETAAIGAASWHTSATIGAPTFGDGVALARSGAAAYLLAAANPASGDAARALYVSTDNGASWTPHRAPCAGSTPYTTGIAAAPGNAVVAMCVPLPLGPRTYLVVSHDSGAHFARLPGSALRAYATPLAGDPASTLVVGGAGGAYRYTAAGSQFARVAGIGGPVSFVGFESTVVGRVVSDGGRTIWTTHDAGATWQPFDFR